MAMVGIARLIPIDSRGESEVNRENMPAQPTRVKFPDDPFSPPSTRNPQRPPHPSRRARWNHACYHPWLESPMSSGSPRFPPLPCPAPRPDPLARRGDARPRIVDSWKLKPSDVVVEARGIQGDRRAL